MPGMLGRQPRTFHPTLPFSALLGLQAVMPPIPPRENNGDNITNFGVMLNDVIGDCTAAAKYHMLQIVSDVSRHFEVTEPDKDVLKLYEHFGYVPTDPNNPQSNDTDQGANMQEVNRYITNVGMPIEPVQGRTVHKLLGTAEVDHQNLDHIARAIYVGGGCDIGFEVPEYIMQQSGHTWDVNPRGNNTIVGGHDVFLKGYELDPNGVPTIFYLVSWGEQYVMTRAFFQAHVDEAYLLADPSWLDVTGRTPSNLTKKQFVDILKLSW